MRHDRSAVAGQPCAGRGGCRAGDGSSPKSAASPCWSTPLARPRGCATCCAGAPASTSAARSPASLTGPRATAWTWAAPQAVGTSLSRWTPFSDCFKGSGAGPVVEVLRAAGYAHRFVERNACCGCGLPWISTGQRESARRQLRQALEVLHPVVAAGVPVVGLEPSCLALWRSDSAELLNDPRLAEVVAGVHTLAELLERTDCWRAPTYTASRSPRSRTATTPPSSAGGPTPRSSRRRVPASRRSAGAAASPATSGSTRATTTCR